MVSLNKWHWFKNLLTSKFMQFPDKSAVSFVVGWILFRLAIKSCKLSSLWRINHQINGIWFALTKIEVASSSGISMIQQQVGNYTPVVVSPFCQKVLSAKVKKKCLIPVSLDQSKGLLWFVFTFNFPTIFSKNTGSVDVKAWQTCLLWEKDAKVLVGFT